MMANPLSSISLPFSKVSHFRANQDSLTRAIATAVTALAALLAILVVSFSYVVAVLA
jgi:hypothetical protein